MNKYSVYMHTSPNGKKYIGITSIKPHRRWANGSGYRPNEHFTSAILKYGWVNFKHEILFTGLTKEEAEQKEIELIAKFKSDDRKFGYNIESGGALGVEVSNETREKLRRLSTGRKATEETKKKMSESHKGEKCYWFGKHLSKEVKEKLSKIHEKAVIQFDIKGNKIRKHESMTKAAKYFGVTRQAIYSCVIGKSKTACGFIWKLEGGKCEKG